MCKIADGDLHGGSNPVNISEIACGSSKVGKAASLQLTDTTPQNETGDHQEIDFGPWMMDTHRKYHGQGRGSARVQTNRNDHMSKAGQDAPLSTVRSLSIGANQTVNPDQRHVGGTTLKGGARGGKVSFGSQRGSFSHHSPAHFSSLRCDDGEVNTQNNVPTSRKEGTMLDDSLLNGPTTNLIPLSPRDGERPKIRDIGLISHRTIKGKQVLIEASGSVSQMRKMASLSQTRLDPQQAEPFWSNIYSQPNLMISEGNSLQPHQDEDEKHQMVVDHLANAFLGEEEEESEESDDSMEESGESESEANLEMEEEPGDSLTLGKFPGRTNKGNPYLKRQPTGLINSKERKA